MKKLLPALFAGLLSAGIPLHPTPGLAGTEHKSSKTTWHFGSFDTGRDFYYAIVERDEDGDVQMSGAVDHRDWEALDDLLGDRRGPVLWFRFGDENWMTRDAAVVKQAREIMRPMTELGKRQGELGRQQGALGRQQGALGREQGRLGARQGRLGARQGVLSREIARAERRGESTREFEREMRQIEAQMDALGEEMEELGRRMEPLSEQQEALGRRQEELGRQQEIASKRAETELRTLARELIRDQRVERVKDGS